MPRRPPFIAFLLFCLGLPTAGFAAENTVRFQHQIPPVALQIAIPVRVGEKEELLIVDTGASDTYLDLTLKDRLTGPAKQWEVQDGNGQSRKLEIYECPSLVSQSYKKVFVPVVLMDLDVVRDRTGLPIMGILGANELASGKLLIDRSQHTITLHQGDWKLTDAPDTPLKISHRVCPCLAGNLGAEQIDWLIDTGYDGALALQEPVFHALVREGFIEKDNQEAYATGANGQVRMTTGKFLKGTLMGRPLAGWNVGTQGGSNKMGLQWLHGFSLELDWRARTARYQQVPAAVDPINVSQMLGGLLLFQDGKVTVARVWAADGGFALAGLEEGDSVETLGGRPARALHALAIYQLVMENAGKTLPATIRRAGRDQALAVEIKVAPLIPVSAPLPR